MTNEEQSKAQDAQTVSGEQNEEQDVQTAPEEQNTEQDVPDAPEEETREERARRWVKPVLLVTGAVFALLLIVFAVLFLSALFADDGDEDITSIRQAEEETTADAEAESLAALLREPAELKEVSPEAKAHRENELVFSFSLADFIDSFNGYYWQDRSVRLLPPQQSWGSVRNHTSIHSDHDTVCYLFTRDEQIHSLPTLTVYVPSDAELIQLITVDFDDHGYDREMFEEYEDMSFYVLRVFFPDLPETTLKSLIKKLNDYAYDHVLPNEEGYSNGAVPQIMYYRNGVGVYPYFAIGQCVHFCVIPVTDASIAAFRAQGTQAEALPENGF